MKKNIITAVLLSLAANTLLTGNKDRIGEPGANELLIIPVASSAALFGANSVTAAGVDALFINPATSIMLSNSQLKISHLSYLLGSSININSILFKHSLDESKSISLGVVNFSFGNIDITTEDNPDGGIGFYTPQILNFYGNFSKAFSDRIFAGINAKVVYHSIGNVTGQALALDAGVLYSIGEINKLKFGLALRNISGKMKYSGAGLAKIATIDEKERTIEERSKGFELPSQMIIGTGYEFYIKFPTDSLSHKLTPSLTFVSNAFGKDQLKLGIEYSYKNYFALRTGLQWEEKIFDKQQTTSVYKGYAAGISLYIPLSKSFFVGFDYAFQGTHQWDGNHFFSLFLLF